MAQRPLIMFFSASLKLLLTIIAISILSSCAPRPPANQNNACSIFKEYPSWYWDALKSYHRWKVPVSVQMAIIHQESHFRAGARPPRTKLFGFIPWTRPTSAYGYAQAVDGTWDHYMKSTGKNGADRNDFQDAVDFVGWYGNQAHKMLGISKRNAYDLYLAYHEGFGGYRQGSYRKKAWLVKRAHKVQQQANLYRGQLLYCKNDIPKPGLWQRLFG